MISLHIEASATLALEHFAILEERAIRRAHTRVVAAGPRICGSAGILPGSGQPMRGNQDAWCLTNQRPGIARDVCLCIWRVNKLVGGLFMSGNEEKAAGNLVLLILIVS